MAAGVTSRHTAAAPLYPITNCIGGGHNKTLSLRQCEPDVAETEENCLPSKHRQTALAIRQTALASQPKATETCTPDESWTWMDPVLLTQSNPVWMFTTYTRSNMVLLNRTRH